MTSVGSAAMLTPLCLLLGALAVGSTLATTSTAGLCDYQLAHMRLSGNRSIMRSAPRSRSSIANEVGRAYATSWAARSSEGVIP